MHIARERNMNISDNSDSDYSSSEEYYLNDEEDKKLIELADRCLVDACEEGLTPWHSDPLRMAAFLKEANEEHDFNIPIDIDKINKQLTITDKIVMKKSPLYQRSLRNFSSSTSSLSSLDAATTPSPSSQTTQTSATTAPPPPRGGREAAVLFIRRRLNKTDICEHQSRLSMPCNQVNEGILTEAEKETLKNKTLTVAAKLVDPGNRVYNVNLRKTSAGPTTCSYAIGKPWNEIKRNNRFRAGMVLDVRGFRGEGGQLCFLLERVVEIS